MIKAILLLMAVVNIQSLDNGLGRVPQMGWNSWNKFGCNINEVVVKQAADKLEEHRLNLMGYKYVNIDDCWQKVERTDDGHV